ncbi:MAG: hypothetical protein DRJ61_03970 [Acidobacteria bacterium]|nr:MAG: hypothetical protein DRJ61_03970 [Acidobacteriota bacterium]
MGINSTEQLRDNASQDHRTKGNRLYRLAVLSYDHAQLILVAVSILMVLSLPWIRGLRIDADFSRLIDTDDPSSAAFAQGKSCFGESNPLFITLTSKALDRELLHAFRERLREHLGTFDDLSLLSNQFLHTGNPDVAAAQLKAALLNQEPSAYRAFLSRLHPANMERQIHSSRLKLVSPVSPEPREVVGIDVLGVFALVRPYLEARVGKAAQVLLDQGTTQSDLSLIALKPRGSAEDSHYCLDLMSRLETVCAHTARDMGIQDQVNIQFAGLHAMTAQSTQVLQREMIQITLLATGLLLLLLWVALRRIPLVLICFLPLLVSMVVLLDIARAVFNPIYFITIGFVAIVLGLGLDVAVHLTGRLVRSLESHTPREAVGLTLCTCARPLLAGILSTAAAFLALFFTAKEALIQFGLLTSIGLVVTLVTTYVLFPAFVRILIPTDGIKGTGTIHLLPSEFFSFFSRHQRWCFVAGVVALGVCVPWAMRFQFHMDLSDFFAQDLPALDATQEIETQSATALTSTFQVHLDAPDLDSASEALKKLDLFFADKVRAGELVLFETPSNFLPYESTIEDSNASTDVTIDRATFFLLLKHYKIKSREEHHRYLDILERVVSLPTDPRELSRLLPEANRLMEISENRVRFQITLWPSTNNADHGSFSNLPAQAVDRELANFALPPGTEVTVAGTAHILATIQQMVKSLFFKIAWISLILVLGTVWLCFRSFSATILSFVPVVGALPAMMAAIVFLKIPVTPTAIAFAAIVVGVGIDDAVHLISQTRPPNGAPIPEVLDEIGPAITLTTASTAIGFACLMWSSHPVVNSLGQSIFIGVLACWAFTLLLLPLLLRWGATAKIKTIRWIKSVPPAPRIG